MNDHIEISVSCDKGLKEHLYVSDVEANSGRLYIKELFWVIELMHNVESETAAPYLMEFAFMPPVD